MSNEVEMVESAEINPFGHLILKMTTGREIDAGQVAQSAPVVENVYIEDNERVMIAFSNGDIIKALEVSELGYKDVDTVRLDGYDVYADYIDGTSEFVGSVMLDANSGIVATYINRQDGFMYGLRYNGDIETIGSMEKYVGDKLSEKIVKITSNDLEEVIIHTDEEEYNIGKIYYQSYNPIEDASNGRKIDNIFINQQTKILTIVYDDGSFEEAGRSNFVSIDGYPILYANAELTENKELVLEYLKINDNGQFVKNTVGVYQPDGSVVYEERFATESVNVGYVGGKDGVDGTIFQNVFVYSDGMLLFTDRDGIQYNAGYLTDRSVVNAYIEEDTGVLVLMLSDGSEIRTSNVLGKDGTDAPSFVDAKIDDDGMLWLVLEGDDIPDIPAGKVRPPSEISMHRDDNDNIIFTLSDGKEYNAGQIPGVASKYTTDIKNINGNIRVKYSDDPDNWHEIGNIDSIPSSIHSDDNKKLVLEYEDGTKVVSDDRIYGLDGDGIIDISLDNRDLVVFHTTQHGKVTEQKRFENVKGRDIDSISYNHEDRKINFHLTDDSTESIELPDTFDGIGIEEFYTEVNDKSTTLNFSLSDKSSESFDLVHGAGVLFDHKKDDGSLVFKSTFGEEYVLPTIRGNDGNSITSVYMTGNKITFEFSELDDFTFELPTGTVQKKSVRDISLDASSTNIIIDFNEPDAESLSVPIAQPEDGDVINDVYLNEDNDLILVFQGRGEVTFPSIRGKDGIGIQDITKEENELVFELDNDEIHKIEISEPIDGIGIESIESTDDNKIEIKLDDGSKTEIELPIGKDAVGIVDVIFDPEISTDMIFKLSDDTSIEIPQIVGKDGKSITDVYYDKEKEKLEIYVEGELSESIPFRTGKDGNSVTDVYFDDLDLIIETDIPDSEENHKAVFPLIKGKDGKDGVSIKDILIDSTTALIFKIDDEEESEYVFPNIGKYILDASLEEDGRIKFSYSNGDTHYTSESVKGRDGNGTGIKDIEFKNNKIIIDIGDVGSVTETIEIPVPTSLVSSADIEDGELKFTMSDDQVINVGRVDGKSGKWISDAFITSNDRLVIVTTDGISEQTEILNDIRGADGRHLDAIDVDHVSGDFSVTYSDGVSDVIGNIKDKLTLSIWKDDQTPYEKDRVVIHNSSLFLSLRETSDEPPSDDWREISFNDRYTDVQAPIALSPRDNAIVGTANVVLRGSVFASSYQEFDYRDFQIDYADTGTLVYSATTDQYDITIPNGILEENESYRWRIRDTTKDGFTTPWSERVFFNVKTVIDAPVVLPEYSSDLFPESILLPSFYIEAGLGDDERAIWELYKEGSDTPVVRKTTDNTSTFSVTQELDKDTKYYVRALIETDTQTSNWSNIYAFTTEKEDIVYFKSPKVVYEGNDIDNVNPIKAIFRTLPLKKSAFLIERGYENVDVEYKYTEWEIRDSSSGEIIDNYKSSLTTRLTTSNYVIDRRYSIRSRHYTNRFGFSPWSPWTEFKMSAGISTPTIETSEDTNNFPNGGTLRFSKFESINDVHLNTSVEVRESGTGMLITENKNSSTVVENFNLWIPSTLINATLNIRVKYHGCIGDSDWSDAFEVTIGEDYEESLITYHRIDESLNDYNYLHTVRRFEVWENNQQPFDTGNVTANPYVSGTGSQVRQLATRDVYEIRRNFYDIQQFKLKNNRVLLLPLGSLMFLTEENSRRSEYRASIVDYRTGNKLIEEKQKIEIDNKYSDRELMEYTTLYSFSEPVTVEGNGSVYAYYPIRNKHAVPILPIVVFDIDEASENITRRYITPEDFPSSINVEMIELVTEKGEIYVSERDSSDSDKVLIHKVNKDLELMHSFSLEDENHTIDYVTNSSAAANHSYDNIKFFDPGEHSQYIYIGFHGIHKIHGNNRTGLGIKKVMKSTGEINKTSFYSYGNLTSITDDFHYNINGIRVGNIRLAINGDKLLIGALVNKSGVNTPHLVYGHLNTNNDTFNLSIVSGSSLPWISSTTSDKDKMLANVDKLSSVFDTNRSVLGNNGFTSSISIKNVFDDNKEVIKFYYDHESKKIKYNTMIIPENYIFEPHKVSRGGSTIFTPPLCHTGLTRESYNGWIHFAFDPKEYMMPSDGSSMLDFFRTLLVLPE